MKNRIAKTAGRILLLMITLLIIYLVIVIITNRAPQSTDTVHPRISGAASEPDTQTEKELSILSWNIGYGGMGADSDFLFDNGSQLRPPSKASVERNVEGILTFLDASTADIMMLQEVPHASWNNYNTPLYTILMKRYNTRQWTYSDDLYMKLLPSFLSIRSGNATASSINIESVESIAIEREPGFFLYIFKKDYRMHVVRLTRNGEPYTFINVHLSAFDDEKVSIREIQLKQILAYADDERRNGRHVIVGGDWNLELTDTDFGLFSTAEEDLFWIRSLPEYAHMEGFTWAVDASTPSVRTAEKPYVPGENYTLVIDGFLVSDSLEIVNVVTKDLSFSPSDHHPVTLTVKPRL